jgi:hypothetical protein
MYNNKKTYLISYAEGHNALGVSFKQLQEQSVNTASEYNCFDTIYCLDSKSIDPNFYEANKSIFSQKKGGGFWLWKPYLVSKLLEKIDEGDFIFYADAFVFFIKNIEPLYRVCDEKTKGILAFAMDHKETMFTKKYVFETLGCTGSKFTETGQNLASFFLLKKNNFTVNFFKEYLNYCCDEKLLTDIEVSPNYADFKAHRHDQSIFSLLLKKHNVETFIDPSNWGNAKRPSGYHYDQLLIHRP